MKKDKKGVIIEKIKRAFNLINNNKRDELKGFYQELNNDDLFKKNVIPLKDIDFSITKEDLEIIETFIQNNFSSNDGTYTKLNENEKEWTPLEKLFFSVLWKNNQVTRFKHLIEGIKDELECSENKNYTPKEEIGDNIPSTDNDDFESNFVFKQFGKFLVKPASLPIVDQHVLRAFLYHKIENIENRNLDYKKGESLKKYLERYSYKKEQNNPLIRKIQLEALNAKKTYLKKIEKEAYYELYKEYIKWHNGLELNDKEINRLIDKTLFVLGKTLKNQIK
jgi:hypothetical protein